MDNKSAARRPRRTLEQLLTLDLPAVFEKANTGDAAAIQSALEYMHDSILFHDRLPPYAQQYLLAALKAGAAGRSVDAALGMNRKGRKSTWTDFDKRLAVDVVQAFMEQGESLDNASDSAAAIVAEASKQALSEPSAWRGYKGRAPTAGVIRRWYVELAPQKL